jgi:nitroreductase
MRPLVADFFAVVGSQRACREFRAEPVTDADVEDLLRAATYAPSAENRQPWVFVVVRDPQARTRIGQLTRTAWREGARSHSVGRLSPALLADVDRGAEGGVSAAPVLVVVGGDTRIGLSVAMASSIFPAVQNLMLAAAAKGLGSALTTLTTAFAAELREVVGLPDAIVPMAVIPLGWPSRPLGPPRRLPVGEKTHRDRYGTPWETSPTRGDPR